ncbi:hypothetical protein AX14_001885 [Amanita brunnescens Koide BX004]|nr:hypothetical protein AX14_001885 [Amanita brunnescens Koide BX004]
MKRTVLEEVGRTAYGRSGVRSLTPLCPELSHQTAPGSYSRHIGWSCLDSYQVQHYQAHALAYYWLLFMVAAQVNTEATAGEAYRDGDFTR